MINLKIEAVLDSINKTDLALLEKEIGNEEQRELGPLKYLAETTGYPMNKVVNWFLLLIIFVFDPLAIALVIAANMAFAQIKKDPEVKMSIPEGMEFNKSYPLDITKEDEKRMDVIGQNGNEGIHYDQEEMIKKNEEILATPKEDIYNEKKKKWVPRLGKYI